MFRDSRKFYNIRKATTVACFACLCGEFEWCMRALHTLIGYHASVLETMTIVQTHQTQADVHSSGNHKQDHAAGVYEMVMVALLVIVVLLYGVFGWCMRALCTLIGYHNSLLSAMTVMALLLSWRVGTEVNGACGYDIVALVTIVVISCAAFGWCMRALCTLICNHTSLVTMFIVTSVHALVMLLW
jgi:uncharacterized membrane protein YdfJ with MMPL/SSD domain